MKVENNATAPAISGAHNYAENPLPYLIGTLIRLIDGSDVCGIDAEATMLGQPPSFVLLGFNIFTTIDLLMTTIKWSKVRSCWQVYGGFLHQHSCSPYSMELSHDTSLSQSM